MNTKQIKKRIIAAEKTRTKTATFIAEVLIHADEIEDLNITDFLTDVGMPTTYAKQVSDTLNLSRLLKERNILLIKIPAEYTLRKDEK